MHAHGGVLKNTAGRDEHPGWLHTKPRPRSREGLDPRDPATWTSRSGDKPDPAEIWASEQRFIEQKQRAIGHL